MSRQKIIKGIKDLKDQLDQLDLTVIEYCTQQKQSTIFFKCIWNIHQYRLLISHKTSFSQLLKESSGSLWR